MGRQSTVRNVVALLVGVAAASGGVGAAEAPRTLVLALDGIPYRVMLEARAAGAFAEWPEPRPLVAPFPSLTNVSFSAMLAAHGTFAARGYEVQHYDPERNKIVGGNPGHYAGNLFAWREAFDVTGRTVRSKLAAYTIPLRKFRDELRKTEATLLDSRREVVLAHLGSTDALQHLRGDPATLALVRELDPWITGLRERHRAAHGRPLRVMLLSDHGNSLRKIRGVGGIRRRLRDAGLRTVKRLERPDDVVAATFGLVGYGALFTAPDNASRAARAVAGHAQIELAVWREGPDTVAVASAEGLARIRWREGEAGRELAYFPGEADPLRLRPVLAEMRRDHLVDEEGWAPDADWFDATVEHAYPDPLHRLVEGLTGKHLESHATVLFSLSPGYSWGMRTARASSKLRGGRLEGTHGGLDAESSLGFVMTDDPRFAARPGLRVDDVLRDYGDLLPAHRATDLTKLAD